MAYKKRLKAYKISNEVYTSILQRFPDFIRHVNINDYLYGTHFNKRLIYIDTNKHKMIIQKSLFYYVTDQKSQSDYWKQIVVELSFETDSHILEEDKVGSDAKKQINNVLKKHYTEKEIDERLNQFEAEYDYKKIQQHSQITKNKTILKFENCVKYDLNGAHTTALSEIFPKCKDYFTKLYLNKEKLTMNAYVGMLVYGHRKTYNWIVQRTTKQLEERIYNECVGLDSCCPYINTDGIIISKPAKLINTTSELGGIKRELADETTCYSYQNQEVGHAYWVIQMGSEIKGNLPLSLRKHIDLRIGKVVDFKKVYHEETDTYTYEDVTEEFIEEFETYGESKETN